MSDVTADREVLSRVVDRLRSMTETRLTRPDEALSAGSVAAECHALAVWAAAASGTTDPVPRLHPLASGDQLAVVGRDFLARAAEGEAPVKEWRERLQQLRDRL